MDYKKVVKSRNVRHSLLKLLNFVPDFLMLKFQYRIKFNRILNLKNPKRFTEKIQWYKINYRNSSMKTCVDKYSVREYVSAKNLESTLNQLYGLYDSPKEINFSLLPNQFVIKTTNGGGGINVIICKDKRSFNTEEAVKTLNNWIKVNKSKGGREWAYYNLKPKIIIEKFLINDENPEAGITDYKFFCFNGVPRYIVVDIDRYIGHKRNFYDVNWKYINVNSDCPTFGDVLSRPKGLNEMLNVAAKLAEDFPFVRVDLYYIEGQVLFGEMTFYPWSGYVPFDPDNFDFILGDSFRLPLTEN